MKDDQVTRFQLELDQMEAVFTNGPIEHENLMAPLRYLKEYAKLSKGGDIVLIVGPSNSGKSTLMSLFAQHLRATTFACVDEQDLPIIGATAQTSRDSRTTPKYLIESLLSDAGHVLHDPAKRALTGNVAGKSASEGRLLQDLRSVFFIRNVRYVMIDEGQFVTRSDNQLFAATLMESLKSMAGPRRNLVICGGYDVVEPALALRAHLSARIVVLHVEPYNLKKNGVEAWAGILKAMMSGGVLAFPDRVIRKCARELLVECHGCVGLLERRLKDAQAHAKSQGLPFDEAAIRAKRPTAASWEAIKIDLEVGERSLSRVEWVDGEGGAVLVGAGTSPKDPVRKKPTPKAGGKRPKPFETKPARYRGVR